MSEGMDLSVPITIRELVTAREKIIASWHETNRSIDEMNAAWGLIHDKDFTFISESRGQRFDERQDKIDIKKTNQELDYSLYVFALGKLNITNAMTEGAKDEFLQKIKEKKTPFTEKELIGLAQNANSLFRDSSLNTVREVFRKLIGIRYNAPASSRIESKRDNLQKVERCFRVGYSDLALDTYSPYGICHNTWRYSGGFSGFRFNDLLTACRLIDGQGVTDYSNNVDAMCRKIPRGQRWVDTGYFTVTAFKNGNCKVTWNDDRIDTLERLNAIGSGRENSMPDTMRKKYKAEHFSDGGMPKAETYFRPAPDDVPSDEKDFAFYPTPDDVARRMVELAEYIDGEDLSTLEPSAGDGQLIGFIPWDFGCRAVEFNHHRVAKLKTKFPEWSIEEADFLKWQPGEDDPKQYDRVIMNPPFNDRLEAQHVVKAFSHLSPGGILVGIIPEGWFYRDDMKAVVMREFLTRNEYKPSEKLAAGTFGRTQIATRIIILRKPE